MITQLKAINSALAMGDRVMLPQGTLLSWVGGSFGESCLGLVKDSFFDENSGEVILRLEVKVVGSSSSYTSLRQFLPRMRVVSLPEDAPPFEEWERPT